MNNFLLAISQNVTSALLCLLFIVLCLFFLLHFYTLKRMFDNDSKYEERYENGEIKSKSYHRNVWDLSFFPPLSKLFFTTDRKIVIAVCLLVSFLGLYMITKEQGLGTLFTSSIKDLIF